MLKKKKIVFINIIRKHFNQSGLLENVELQEALLNQE